MRSRRTNRRSLKSEIAALRSENAALRSAAVSVSAKADAVHPSDETVSTSVPFEPKQPATILSGGFPTRAAELKAHNLKEAKEILLALDRW